MSRYRFSVGPESGYKPDSYATPDAALHELTRKSAQAAEAGGVHVLLVHHGAVPRPRPAGHEMTRPLKPSTAAAELELAASLAAPLPPPLTKIIKPSMSATDRFLECAWPWGREVEVGPPVGSPARFGSAVHEVLEYAVPARKLMSKKKIAEPREDDLEGLAREFDVVEAVPK